MIKSLFTSFLAIILLGGPMAMAKTCGAAEAETKNLKEWVVNINLFDPSMSLKILGDLSNATVRHQVEAELKLLEHSMFGEVELPAKSLKSLSCNQPRCGGGSGGGNCTTCLHDVTPDSTF